MNNMLWFDHDLYVIENMILVITENISLIIIINTVDIMQQYNKTNFFPIYAWDENMPGIHDIMVHGTYWNGELKWR